MDPSLREDLDGLLATCRKAVEAYGREDLLPVLAAVPRDLDRAAAVVVVLGAYKAGKSSLVNALVGADLCPVDVDLATALPTSVARGPEERLLVTPSGERAIDDVQHTAQHPPEDAVALVLRSPEVVLPAGVVVVDGTGAGGLRSVEAGAMSFDALAADLALLVTDGGSDLDADEAALLDLLLAETVVEVVLSRTDLTRHAHRVAASIEDRWGARAPRIWQTSAVLEPDESDVSPLRARIAGLPLDAGVRRAVAARTSLLRLVDDLAAPFAEERAVLVDRSAGTDAPDEAVRTLAACQSARSLLAARLAGVPGDVDHDFRRRVRVLRREAEDRLEDDDPRGGWDELVSWVRSRVLEEVSATLLTLHGGLADAAEEILRGAVADVDHQLGTPRSPDALGVLDDLDLVRPTALAPRRLRARASRLADYVKGAQGGVTSAAVLSGVGATLVAAPLALAVGGGLGAALGTRAIIGERERQRRLHRSEARAAVQRYLDDVAFEVAKPLRELATDAAAEVRLQVVASLARAEAQASAGLDARRRAASLPPHAAADRLRDVDAELARLRALRERVERWSR